MGAVVLGGSGDFGFSAVAAVDVLDDAEGEEDEPKVKAEVAAAGALKGFALALTAISSFLSLSFVGFAEGGAEVAEGEAPQVCFFPPNSKPLEVSNLGISAGSSTGVEDEEAIVSATFLPPKLKPPDGGANEGIPLEAGFVAGSAAFAGGVGREEDEACVEGAGENDAAGLGGFAGGAAKVKPPEGFEELAEASPFVFAGA